MTLIVKTFKANNQTDLENQMNEFLKDKDSWYIESTNVSMTYNFLPQTNLGELMEIWIGSVTYSLPEEE